MNVPESFFTVHEQLVLFGLSCVFGAVLGICYDVFRTLRIVLPHNSWLVAAEDIIFMLGYGIFLSVFVSAVARGEFRFYYVIGNLIGFILYLITAGTAVVAAVRKLFSFIKLILSVIMRPFRSVYVFLCRKYRLKFVGSSKNSVRNIKKIKLLLQKHNNMLYNKKENKNRRRVKEFGKQGETRKEKKGTVQQRSR